MTSIASDNTSKPESKTLIGNPVAQTLIDRAIELAIAEDLGLANEGDITSNAIMGDESLASAVVLLKEPGVVAGLEIFTRVMNRYSNKIVVDVLIAEGSHIEEERLTHQPLPVIKLAGPSAAILGAERVALNLIQRMSGVATMTKKFVDKASPFGISILDTRKTTPCLRVFEKYAVASAGGVNHRMGLFDCILIKENHIRVAGGITNAIQACRTKLPGKPVEVEVTNMAEVEEAVSNQAEKILLDNMTPEMVRESIAKIAGKSKIEVSGGINFSNIDRYLIEGVDYISIGALTHSVKAIDLSLEILEITTADN
jgi:nicotinate-nucleotide pyrophosphorylase (carboxylating)